MTRTAFVCNWKVRMKENRERERERRKLRNEKMSGREKEENEMTRKRRKIRWKGNVSDDN